MTIHIQMLQEIATNAQAMAEAAHAMAASMQAIVDDCARQLALRKAAGESEEAVMNEAIGQAATGKPGEPADDQGHSGKARREETHRASGKPVCRRHG